MALITAAQARLALPALTGTVEDTTLGTVIDAIGRAFARHCGYPPASVGGNPTMESATYTLYLTGDGSRKLHLPVHPATAITSIEDDETLDFDGSTYLVSSGDYNLREGRYVLLTATSTHGAWSAVEGAIKIVYAAGFSTVPDDLALAARFAVKHWYELTRVQGKSSSSMGETSESFRDEAFLPPHVVKLLAPFRLGRAYL